MLKPILPIMLLGLALSMSVEAARSYGPVKDQDTLWKIATQLRPDQRATVQQTMLALYYKNPQAFASNNINSLMKGAVLKAPSSAEARRYQRLKALREARKHNVYWAKGAQLPYAAPPPVPKIKVHPSPKRSQTVVVKASTNTSNYAPTPKSTQRRIARLQAQLQTAESKNKRLTAELQTLQAKQTDAKPNPQLDTQVKKLKLELQDLTSVLSQKDNHIKTLQSSLKNASETIKSQHADNMRLYDKLKEVSPSSLPATPSSEGKAELKLTTVEAATAAVTGAAASAAMASNLTNSTQGSQNSDSKTETASTDNQDTATKVWADQQTTTPDPAAKNTTESATDKTDKTSDTKALTGTEPQTSKTAAPPTTAKSSAEPQILAAAVTPSSSATPSTNPSNNSDATKPEANQIGLEADKINGKAATATAEAKASADLGAGGVASQSATPPNSEIKAPSDNPTAAKLAPTNDVKTSSSVPVSQMLAQPSHAADAQGSKTSSSSTPLRGVSPLALAIALISLLFILALVWRAFLQSREMRRLEAEEARVAERMRKRLEENQSSAAPNVVDRKEADLEANTEIKF